MTINDYREEIKLKLTGYLIEMELDDPKLDLIIKSALREVQRYICETNLITIPYSKCIDLSDPANTNNVEIKVNSVSRVYRTEGYVNNGDSTTMDPMQVAQWQMLSGTGNMYNFQDYVYNYLSWNTLLQIRNTTSTDLAFIFDKASNCLYITTSSDTPQYITVEYVPDYQDVEDVASDFWIDVIMQMSIALTKITLGRIRSRYTQTNALWTQDGEAILAEGNAEYQALQEYLRQNTQLVYGID